MSLSLFNIPNIVELTWRLVYFGSPDSNDHDQVLEELDVGPISHGVSEFRISCNAPDIQLIPTDHVMGMTGILVQAAYKNQDFLSVGYFVRVFEEGTELENEESLADESAEEAELVLETPTIKIPIPADQSTIMRAIDYNKPRMCRYDIKWAEVVPTAMEM